MDYKTFERELKLKDTALDRRKKLSIDNIEEIKKMFKKGASKAAIAKKFKVSPSTIYYHLGDDSIKKKNAINRMHCYYKKRREERYTDNKLWRESTQRYKKQLYDALMNNTFNL